MTAETDLLPLPEYDIDTANHAGVRLRGYTSDLTRAIARANLAERDAEVEALRAEVKLLTHKVITCGVAADHPDQNLTRTDAYASEWNSQQAERVRALRDRAERLAEALRGVLPFVATQAIGCHGDKCREEWFYSCSGEEEAGDVAQRGREAFRAATAALEQENDDA